MMIDIETLFRLNGLVKNPSDVAYLSITDPQGMGVDVSFGHPAIGHKEAVTKGSFSIVVPFPSERSSSGLARYSAHKHQIIVHPNRTPLVENHKVVSIERVRVDMIDAIMKTVNLDGGVTFFIADPKGAIESYKNGLKIMERFQYLSNICYNLDNGGGSGTTVGLLSFFHLHHAIPVFNDRKTDGVAMIFRVIFPDRSIEVKQVVEKSSVAMVAANHKDNILVVDGVSLRSPGGPPSALVEHFESRLNSKKTKASGGSALQHAISTSTWVSSDTTTGTWS
jgi:hypothetical protein